MDEVIGDRYEMQEPIGRGGMATIFRAIDLRMGRTVAVKILREVYSTDPKFVTRFQREARAASALQHPNIVQVFDYGQSGENYFIVMEFIDGMDLRRYMKRTGVLDNDRAVEITHDVALGLGAAHRRGIVHRDVKPQNILLNDDGLVKLTDFGIASMYKDADAERLTTTGMTLGTVQYYAPEQAQGEIVSPAADVYALGIVLYELLTGRTPFDGDTPVAVAMRHIQEVPALPTSLNPRIAPGLERIIMRCLEKDPRDRYRDGDALAYALENYGRAPQRRTGTGAGAPVGRPPFAPMGLPQTEQRTPSGPRPAGGYGGPVVAGGMRGATPPGAVDRMGLQGGMAGDPRDAYGGPPPFGSAPTYGGYDDFTENGVTTRPRDPAGGTVPRMSGPMGAPGRGDDPNKRNGPIVAVVVASVVLLLGLVCFLVFVLANPLSALTSGPSATATVAVAKTTVPNFKVLTLAAAQQQAATSHLTLTIVQKADPADKGTILDQTPAAGTSVEYGTAVTLTVSTGPGSVKVPDVVSKPTSFNTACSDLQAVNLVCVVKDYQPSQTVPTGDVIKTDPAAGSPVAPNTQVYLTVSSGAPAATATATAAAPTATTAAPTATTVPAPTATCATLNTPTPCK